MKANTVKMFSNYVFSNLVIWMFIRTFVPSNYGAKKLTQYCRNTILLLFLWFFQWKMFYQDLSFLVMLNWHEALEIIRSISTVGSLCRSMRLSGKLKIELILFMLLKHSRGCKKTRCLVILYLFHKGGQ